MGLIELDDVRGEYGLCQVGADYYSVVGCWEVVGHRL